MKKRKCQRLLAVERARGLAAPIVLRNLTVDFVKREITLEGRTVTATADVFVMPLVGTRFADVLGYQPPMSIGWGHESTRRVR